MRKQRDRFQQLFLKLQIATFNEEGCLIEDIGCLQLVLKAEVFSMESIKKMIDKARTISTHANHSTVFSNRLEEKQRQFGTERPLVIIGDVSTRWNR